MACPNNEAHEVRYEYAPNGGPLQMFCPTCTRFWDACPVTLGTAMCVFVKGHEPPHVDENGNGWTINILGVTKMCITKE